MIIMNMNTNMIPPNRETCPKTVFKTYYFFSDVCKFIDVIVKDEQKSALVSKVCLRRSPYLDA